MSHIISEYADEKTKSFLNVSSLIIIDLLLSLFQVPTLQHSFPQLFYYFLISLLLFAPFSYFCLPSLLSSHLFLWSLKNISYFVVAKSSHGICYEPNFWLTSFFLTFTGPPTTLKVFFSSALSKLLKKDMLGISDITFFSIFLEIHILAELNSKAVLSVRKQLT